jgi:hypothetical protein
MSSIGASLAANDDTGRCGSLSVRDLGPWFVVGDDRGSPGLGYCKRWVAAERMRADAKRAATARHCV